MRLAPCVRRIATAVAIVVAAAACYERGKSKPSAVRDDAAVERVAVDPVPAKPGDPSGPADPAAEVVVRLEAEPAHLNPLLGGDAIAQRVVMGDVYEGLLCRGQLGAPPRPCLAERVEVDAEGTEWLFRLRRGVRWHDGEPFTAADVVFTYQLLTGPAKAPSVLAGELDDLRTLEQVDDHTVRMRFAGFRVGRDDLLASVPVLPRHVFGDAEPAKLARAAASRAPIGTGPLRFTAWTAGEGITLERFDDYWGDKARSRRVRYRLFSSRRRAVDALLAGELHVILQMPADEAKAAADGDAGARLFAYDTSAYLAAVWNLRRPALADVRVRRALGLLLDRRGIVEQVFKGYARIVDGPFPPRGPVVPVISSFAAARRRAAKLLAAAGGNKPEVTLLVPSGSRSMERIADIWAADAAPYATLRVDKAPFGAVLSRARAGRFDAVLLAFGTGDEFDHHPRFHSSQIGQQNYGGLADEPLDAALDAVRSTPDRDGRRALEDSIAQRLDELQPYCFMVSDQRVGIARVEVGGISMTLDGLSARSLWLAK